MFVGYRFEGCSELVKAKIAFREIRLAKVGRVILVEEREPCLVLAEFFVIFFVE